MPAPNEPAASLAEAERVTWGAIANAGDAHWRLRPVLRDVATPALHARGIDLDGDPVAVRALIGNEAWELVRPDRPRPDDPFAPGMPPAALARILRSLEDLQP